MILIKKYLAEMELMDYEKEIEVKEKNEKIKIKELNETKADLQRQQIQKGELENEIKLLMKSISMEYTQLKNIEQLDNVIDTQTMSELEKEIISLMQYYDNLKNRKD